MSLVFRSPYNLRTRPLVSRNVTRNMQGVARAARVRMARRMGSMTATTTRNRSYAPRGVTSQRDSTLIYRKKSMPRRRRKRWVNFVRKVIAADNKQIGTKTLVYNGSTDLETFGDQQQNIGACHLYAASPLDDVSAVNEIGLKDLRTMLAQDPETQNPTDKVMFASAVLDITMTNTSPQITLPNEDTQRPPLEVDVYDIIYRKESDWQSLTELFNQTLNETNAITSGGTQSLNILARGWTPFDATQALATTGIKILRKTKYFIPYLDSVTYQVRDPRNRSLTRSDVYNTSKTRGYLAPKGRATRTILIVSKPVAGLAPNDPLLQTSNLRVGATRKYSYKIMQTNQDKRFYTFQV